MFACLIKKNILGNICWKSTEYYTVCWKYMDVYIGGICYKSVK